MSLLFGSGKKQKPQYSSLQVQTSASNMPIPMAWGLCLLSPNVLWYGDFASHPAKTSGGKGGGGKGGQQKDYTAAVILALCQGVVLGIPNVWVQTQNNELTTLSKLNLSLISGTSGQAPWSYLTANHPDQALAYPDLAYLASPKYDLGSSASLPQHYFETQAPRYASSPNGKDADVALVIQDFLTLPIWGCGFPSSDLGTDTLLSSPAASTTGDACAQTYCTAMGFGMSPALTSQENGLTTLKRWCDLFNIAPMWNGVELKFIPFSQEAVTGNGVTYLPSTTSVYSLTDADYVSDSSSAKDPVVIKRQDFTKVKNRLTLEILSRAKQYNAVPIEHRELGLIDRFGDLPDSVFTAHEICEATMATIVAQIMLQRNAYRAANEYTFTLGPEFCLLEGMDLITIFDPQLGSIQLQIDNVEEDDKGNLKIVAYEVAPGSTTATGFAAPDQTPGGKNAGVSPGSVNTPIIIEPPSSLAGDAEVWVALSGGANYGGSYVWVSTDNTTFSEIGEAPGQSRMGVTTTALAAYGGANPDTTDSLGVDLSQSNGSLIGVSSSDAANGVTLSVLKDASGSIELISFSAATLTTTSHYTLGTQLYRGLYGTPPASHLSGVAFARLDDAIFKYKLPPQYIGKTLYFKFQAYNTYGTNVQDISTCTAYVYTPSGAGYGTGAGGAPATPTGMASSSGGGFAMVTWNANPTNDNVQRYDVYRAAGPSGTSGSATKIGSSSGPSYTDTSGVAGTTYTYFVKAVNAIGSSGFSSGIDATPTAGSGSGSPTTTITASAALNDGDLVNIYDSGGGVFRVRQADASAGYEAHGFVKAAVASGAVATVYGPGINDHVSGLSPGVQYLSDSTPGKCSTTVPTTSGHLVQEVGTAAAATVLMFEPRPTVGLR